MRVTLHIGLPKTGTTFVQAFLERHRDRLREAGVLYPKAGTHDAARGSQVSAWLAAADDDHVDDCRMRAGLAEPTALAAFREARGAALAAEIAAARPAHLLISCEHLSARVHTDAEFERLAAWAHGLGGPVRIVVFLREQTDLLASLYAEEVRSGIAAPFSAKEAGPDERPEPAADRFRAPWYLRYDALLSRWAERFGEDAIRVRLFRDPGRAGDLVDAFAEAAEIGPVEDWPRPDPARIAPSAAAVALMRWHNRLIPRFRYGRPNPRWRPALIRRLAEAELGPPWRLPAGDAARLRQRHAEGNAAVARRWLGREAPFG